VAERVREAPVILAASALAARGCSSPLFAPTPASPTSASGSRARRVGHRAHGARARGPPRARQRADPAISRAAVIGFLGFFIGPPAIGFVSEATSLRVALALVALLLVLVPVMLALLLRGRAVRMA
jgi:hypothetical protein